MKREIKEVPKYRKTKNQHSHDPLEIQEARIKRLNDAASKLPTREQLEQELDEIKKSKQKKNKKTSRVKLIDAYETNTAAINEIIRRKIIEEDRLDLLCTYVLGYQYEDFHAELSDFQNAIIEVDNKEIKANRSLSLAPRGGGKSTILTTTQVIHELLKNPNIRILLTSNTQLQAESFLRVISQHLTENKKLIDIFGEIKHSKYKWDSREINVAGRTRKGKEASLMCIGLGGGLTGLHFDLIIGDDLVDEENARTKHQRDTCFTWFYKTMYPTLEPDGRLYLIGTRYHPDDLYGRLEKEEFRNRVNVIPAIRKTEEGEECSFWPERFPLKKLHSMRRAMGIIIFNTQMQNNTDLMIGRMIKPEFFNVYKKVPETSGFYVQGTDSATSTKDKDDYFAHVTLFITKEPQPNVYLVDYVKRKMSVKHQYDYCVRKNAEFDPLRVFIESNAGQAYFAEGLKLRDLPVKRVYSTKDKINEMYKVLPIIEDGRFYVKSEHAEFVNDMVVFPDGDDDDLADACRQALKGALFSKIRKTRKKEPGVIRG